MVILHNVCCRLEFGELQAPNQNNDIHFNFKYIALNGVYRNIECCTTENNITL